MNLTFADRCAIATGCLPRDDYRTKLEALHAEMLAALAASVVDHACTTSAVVDHPPHLDQFIPTSGRWTTVVAIEAMEKYAAAMLRYYGITAAVKITP